MRRAAAAVAVVVLAVTGVALAEAARRHVHPHARVMTTTVAGGSVRFALRVSFSAPTGIRGPSPCRGRVVVRADGRRWTGRLAPVVTGCAAAVDGRLPARFAGRRVGFRIRFAGNDAVAPFSVRRSLRLSPMPPPIKPFPTPPPPPAGAFPTPPAA
jgi:hypothetical protein